MARFSLLVIKLLLLFGSLAFFLNYARGQGKCFIEMASSTVSN